jgi:argininosuccinate synthase
VGSKETLTSDQYLDENAFPSQIVRDDSLKITIDFEEGEPVALNEKGESQVEIIAKLNSIAGQFAIGRDIHIGDTIVGIKGRVGFEAPAAVILIKAHHTLEKHILTSQQLFIKDQLSMWYGSLMHQGLFLDPVMRDIESFLLSSQKRVTGTVIVRLMPYHFLIEGISSKYDLLQSDFGKYGEENNAWSGSDARSFAKIFSNQIKLYNSIDDE